MPAETLGTTVIESESFLEPTRYRVRYQCQDCGHRYSKTVKAVPKVDPPCPNKACAAAREVLALKAELANMKAMIESGAAPAQIGKKVVVKAVDETARIVMEDYNMTNLKDNIRQGESVAPKLPPVQQRAADNYFGGGALASRGMNARQTELLGRRAIAGAFRNMAVPPTAIVPGAAQGQSPLRVLRTEPLGGGKR